MTGRWFGTITSETSFKGLVNWPSEGGTYDDCSKALQSLPHLNSEALVTLGLVSGQDSKADPLDRKFGNITAMIHMVGNAQIPAQFDASDWRKVINVEQNGAKPGVYPLSYPASWLVVLPEWKGFDLVT